MKISKNKITADLIYTGEGNPLKDHVIVTDIHGKILDISPQEDHEKNSYKRYDGIICPGFVNAHCHLELSHMKGVIDTGTGLLKFLEDVVSKRDFSPEIVHEAILRADREMHDEGIVAVGDISNKTDTAKTKENSPILYYTFVEMFDFMQSERTEEMIGRYKTVYDTFSTEGGNKKSFVPHAPYTVSLGLYEYIRNENYQDVTISIHNQETEVENRFFINGDGPFVDFFKNFGASIPDYIPTGKPSIYHAMNLLNATTKTIMVHNTMTSQEDVKAANMWNKNVYWATCPNANLYIENRLPDYRHFISEGAKMVIGTDSLTSNWQLSILEEIKTIKKYASYVDIGTLIQWATKNGAAALGYDHLGTIKKGKSPGLVHISNVILEGEEPDISEAMAKKI